MKKNLTIFHLPFIFIFLSFFISCQKQTHDNLSIDPKLAIVTQSKEKQYQYVRENLKIVMKELAPLMKNKEFINYMHSEIAKKFDGCTEVLVKTLVMNPKFSALINNEKIKKALDAFIGIDGQNLYPQIYIPNFAKFNDKRNNPSYRTDENTIEELVIYDGTEPQTTAPSYTYNEEGSVIPTGTIVNEQYALNNEIYIVSINETVDNDASVPPLLSPIGPSTPTLTNTTRFEIEYIYVKDTKESWLAGDSEVHIKAFGATYNHRRDGNPYDVFADYPTTRTVDNVNAKGFEIKKVPRSDITSGVGSQYFIH